MRSVRKMVLLSALAMSIQLLPARANAGDGRNYWYAPVGIPCRQFPYDPSESGAAQRAKEECERATKKSCTTYSAPVGAPGYIC